MNLTARFKAIINRLMPSTSFARNVGILVGGTAIAQAINVLALPLITRLYSPEDFSVLAVFASITGIISIISCLRLDVAIPLAQSDEDAINLLVISLLTCTAVALLSAIPLLFLADQILNLTGETGLRPFLWMIPFGIWLTSIYSAMQFWATRKKRFSILAKTRLTQTIGNITTQITFGVLGALGAFGLLLGQIINSSAGIITLLVNAWRTDQKQVHSVSRHHINRVFNKYDRYPKYSTFEAFSNNMGIQLPIIIIAAASIGPDAGYLFLAMRVMTIPMGLIGSAVSQVFQSRALEEFNAGTLPQFTKKIISGLLKSGVGPLLFTGIVAPTVFPLIFGPQWERAGQMITWMCPWFILQFLSSSISISLYVTKNHRLAFFLQIFGFIVRVGFTSFAVFFAQNRIFEYYSFSGFIFYATCLWCVFKVINLSFFSLLELILKETYILTLWITAAILTASAISWIF